MKKLLAALFMILIPSIALAGGYVDLTPDPAPPTIKDVLIANPPPVSERIIERTEVIKEVEKPINPAYGAFVGFNDIYPTIGYAQSYYTLTAGAQIRNGYMSGLLKMSGKVADLSNKNLTVNAGLALFPGSSYCAFSLYLGGERYITDKIVLYSDIGLLSAGNGNSVMGTIEWGGRYFF